MRVANWEEVPESTGSSIMRPGAYVLEITDINDIEDWEQLEVIYDVVEGEFAGKYKNATPDDDWRHRLKLKYSERAMGFFKSFLKELQEDNPKFVIRDWQVTSDPKALIGLKFGALLREGRYISPKTGKAGWSLELATPMTIDDVKAGKWTEPKPRYTNCDEAEWTAMSTFGSGTTVTESTAPSAYDDVPFL